MTKQQLIEKIACSEEAKGLSRLASADFVESFFDHLTCLLKKRKRVTYPGFGTFLVRHRKAKRGRNPHTGEPLTISASKTVIFRPAERLKKQLKQIS